MKQFTHVLVGNEKRSYSSFDLESIYRDLNNLDSGNVIVGIEGVKLVDYELKDNENVYLYSLGEISNEELKSAEKELNQMFESGGKYFVTPYYIGIKVFKC